MALVPDLALRRRKELTHGAWNLYVEYCRHRNFETGRCDPALSTLAENLEKTYGYISDCKAELVRKGWLARDGKNAVELLVGFPPPRVRSAPAHPKYRRRAPARKKNPDTSPEIFRTYDRKNPDTSPGATRTQVRELPGNGAAPPITEHSSEHSSELAGEAAASAAASPGPPDRGTEVCTEAYVAEVKALGRYSPEYVEFVWRKLREHCAEQSRRFGYPVPPVRYQFDWWLKNELTPPQQSLFTGAGAAADIRLGPKSKCGPDCTRCFGTGMWYPGGFERGVARCPGPPAEANVDEGLKVANGGGVD